MLASLVTGGLSKYLLMGTAGIAVVLGGLWLWTSAENSALEADIVRKESQIEHLTTEVETRKKFADMMLSIQTTLEDRIKTERQEALELKDRLKEIENETEDANGPVADVLRNSIDRLPN